MAVLHTSHAPLSDLNIVTANNTDKLNTMMQLSIDEVASTHPVRTWKTSTSAQQWNIQQEHWKHSYKTKEYLTLLLPTAATCLFMTSLALEFYVWFRARSRLIILGNHCGTLASGNYDKINPRTNTFLNSIAKQHSLLTQCSTGLHSHWAFWLLPTFQRQPYGDRWGKKWPWLWVWVVDSI